MKKIIFVALAVVLLVPYSAFASVLLEVDLSVADTITISATSGVSDITVSGSDTIGVYLDNFFAASGSPLTSSLVAGDLTNVLNPSDGSPALFRGGSGTDPGLNVWSFSSDATVDFVAGTTAFTGSGTWTVSSALYADALAAPTSGTLYFPADTLDDLATGALAIGTWEVIARPAAGVPLPGSLFLMSLGLLGVGVARRFRS